MKKTKILSRRRRTLRRVLISAAIILLINRIFMIGLLFPIQAIRHFEERAGTGRTAVIYLPGLGPGDSRESPPLPDRE